MQGYYSTTVYMNDKIYSEWKAHLKSKGIFIGGKKAKLQPANAAAFEYAMRRIMCMDNGCDCSKCETCDYDYLIKQIEELKNEQS